MLLTATGAAGAQLCAPAAVGPLVGVERSLWREYGDGGSTLVREEGNLGRIGVEASLVCGRARWGLRWSRIEGSRNYEGVTNTGTAVATVSTVRDDAFAVVAMRSLDAHFSLGARAEHRNIHRSIENTAFAAGYPERFRYWSVAAGGRYRRALGERLSLSVDGWIGAGPAGRVLVDLPRADPAELRLGRSRIIELGVQIGSARPHDEVRGWSWSAGLSYRAETLGAGDPQVLFRGPVPVGVASQPRTTQSSLGVFAAAALVF
jgi:hypothetical protein